MDEGRLEGGQAWMEMMAREARLFVCCIITAAFSDKHVLVPKRANCLYAYGAAPYAFRCLNWYGARPVSDQGSSFLFSL